MRHLTFPRILIVFYGVAVAAVLLIYFLTGRNLPIREIILILTFLFLLLYRIHFFLSPHSAAEQSPEQNTRTRRINPRLGWLGLLGLLGILGFFTGEGFLFLFFWFFGFFGFSMKENFPIRCGTNVSSSTSSAPVPPPASWASPSSRCPPSLPATSTTRSFPAPF